MVIVMEQGAEPAQVDRVIEVVQNEGFNPFVNPGVERKVIAVLGVIDSQKVALVDKFENLPGVERVTLISEPYKLSSRQYHPADTVVKVGDATFGGPETVVIAGPCSVESRDQLLDCAHAVKQAGAKLLRGGAFKPRTSPYSFQGLKEDALALLAEARQETGLPIVRKSWIPTICRWSVRSRTCSRWARATCRITGCWSGWATPSFRCS
jgi:3-deoxy-7-phosphoheptulonate synthase